VILRNVSNLHRTNSHDKEPHCKYLTPLKLIHFGMFNDVWFFDQNLNFTKIYKIIVSRIYNIIILQNTKNVKNVKFN